MASSLSLPDSRVLSYKLDSLPANAPVVLLSNSLCAPYNAWDRVVTALNENGFRTLCYDQPGHGGSSTPSNLSSTTIDSLAADVRSLLDALGLPHLHGWVGVSMGAATGIQFAARYPGIVSRLAICDTISCSSFNAGFADVFGPRVAAARQLGHMEDITQGTLERWFGTEWMDENPLETARMRSLMSTTSLDGFETCCAALRSETFDLRPLFAQVGSGVDHALCVVGEKDANLPQSMEEMSSKIQEGFASAGKLNTTGLKVVERAGHVCFVDGYDQFMSLILSFLKS